MAQTVSEQPRLLLVAGPNGAGKTTVTERGLAHTWFAGCEYINPDLIARDTFGDWNAYDSILKAANLAAQKRSCVCTSVGALLLRVCFLPQIRCCFYGRPWLRVTLRACFLLEQRPCY